MAAMSKPRLPLLPADSGNYHGKKP